MHLPRLSSLAIFAALGVTCILLSAGDARAFNEAVEGRFYEFPKVAAAHEIDVGYRLSTGDEGSRAVEYLDASSSPTLRIDVLALPSPHRIGFKASMLSVRDYTLDWMYAYSDMVLVRMQSVSSYHNLDPTKFLTGPGPSRHGASGLGQDVDLGIHTQRTQLSLRIKPMTFPAHLYAKGRLQTQQGHREQRFLGGDGGYGVLERMAVKRKVDRVSTNLSFGANAHLGRFEVDVAHTEAWFAAKGDAAPTFDYSGAAPVTSPYAVVADYRSRRDELRVHSNYSGGMVMSGTVSRATRDNLYSKSASTSLNASSSMTYIPTGKAQLGLRLRYRDVDLRNPEGSEATGRRSVRSTSGTASAHGLLRVGRALSLRARVDHTVKQRRRYRVWRLPRRSVHGSGQLTAHARLTSRLRLKLGVRHLRTDAPAYQTTPSRSDWGTGSISWTSAPVLLQLRYEGELSRRKAVGYEVDGLFHRTGSREQKRHMISGRASLLLFEPLRVSGYFSLANRRDEQDLAFESFTSSSPVMIEQDVLYQEDATVVGGDLSLQAAEAVQLGLRGVYTESRATFASQAGGQVLPIGALSRLRLRQGRYSGFMHVQLPANWRFSADVAYFEHLNLRADPWSGGGSSSAWLVSASAGRTWN